MGIDFKNCDYRYSHLTKGKEYDEKFYDNSYRSLIWNIEKIILKNITLEIFSGQIINYLDFACGTGRILSFLENYASNSIGIDVSESMLAVAKNNVKKSKIICGDITKDFEIFEKSKFDLISAFRFFAKAQIELRIETLNAINFLLKKNGYLVFNNHTNHHNLVTNRGKRLLKKLLNRDQKIVLTENDVKKMLAECGFKIVKIYHVGVFNYTEKKQIGNNSWIEKIEKYCTRIPFMKNVSHDIIYLCRKK